ncbi:cutinase [Actinomadura sp. NBRC 104425]|uniref:cutinase family protein n=1 Tax=Actinomadura sp. NBRC 104425 TaxID=3032204 RepID=UPI0024A27102|nr:cutinase family protein [Actinomadura sp. NBRC 104425]GLZ12994.1 cutinase [Actinomadura sp. NBRC 104425]
MRLLPRPAIRRLAARITAVTSLAAGAVVALQPALPASAACADIDVVVARGTGEPGTLGLIVGDPVYSALQRKILFRSLKSYAVDYPASVIPGSASEGNTDLVDHVTAEARSCPNQKFILVGYSQGANVVDNSIGISSDGALVGGPITKTIPASVEPRVAAVLLFGNPIRAIGRRVTGTYESRTLDICADGDPICGGGLNILAHLSYGNNADQAAQFAAGKV